MDYKIIDIEGIGPKYAEKLQAVGINTSADLLEKGKTVKGRKELAESTGISGKRILTWVNHCDLYRINGVGPQFAELLEASGVDTVVELSVRNPANLERKMKAVNEAKHLTRRVPTAAELEKMIAQAKELPRVMTYGKVKATNVAKKEKPAKEEKPAASQSGEVRTVNIYEDDDVRIVDYDQYDDGKWGLKDENGNWVEIESQKYDYANDTIPMVSKFDEIEEWCRGLIMIQEGEDWGLINPEGEWIVSNFGGFDETEGYLDYMIGWSDGDEWHIYPDGRVVMACMEDDEDEDWDEDDWED